MNYIPALHVNIFIYPQSMTYIPFKKAFYVILSQNFEYIFLLSRIDYWKGRAIHGLHHLFSLGEHCFHILVHFLTFKGCANKDVLLSNDTKRSASAS